MPVGFNDIDPLAGKAFGYRSHLYKETANPFMTDVADVIYNGFTFPPVLNARGTIVPEYDRTQRTVKYLTIAITISGIITQYDRAAPTDGNGTIDPNMDAIRDRLCQPCQPLIFKLQGFGTFHIQQGATFDVDYGPKPQVLDWHPMGGGLAAEIEWLVTTRIPACSTANSFYGIIELNYDVAWSIGDAGLLARTVTGYVEIAKTKLPTGTTSANPVISTPSNVWEAIRTNLARSFPPLPAFERAEDFRDGANRKTLNFTFKDTEIPSPSPYPAGVLKMDLTESLSSSFSNAFYEWDWRVSGNITVPHTSRGTSFGSDTVNNKRLAWAAIGLILKERRARAAGLSYYNATKNETSPSEYIHKVTFIPQNIKFDNEMFGMGISIDVSYLLLCPSELVLQASGMFDHVRVPGMTWQAWRDFLNRNNVLAPKIRPTPQQEMIVDLCHPLTSFPPGDSFVAPAQTTSRSLFSAEAPEEDSSWVRYNNRFLFKNKSFTTVGTVLSPSAKQRYEEGARSPKDQNELVVTKDDSSSGSRFMLPDLQTSADEICYVTMIGNAVRIGYPINAPELVAVGGAPVAKYGTDRIEPQSRPSGFKKGSEKVSIYKLSWRKSYIITTNPQGWTVATTGLPQAYR